MAVPARDTELRGEVGVHGGVVSGAERQPG